ncbi:hypothetical protein HGRIS_006763 [Hohenbuehelia grisea]|uniref:Uncharacterized protein n=1 Tax=Hohenbuehelia grisea TaxID=104357 RepID=A0ABR3JAI1_9AGAR
MVHSGNIRYNTGASRGTSGFLFEVYTDTKQNVLGRHQYPSTGSGEKDGKDNHYEINYGQRFQMLSNEGQEAFTFDAGYIESFTRKETSQTGALISDGVKFVIDSNPAAGSTIPENTTHAIHGLSVFTSEKLSVWPYSFNFVNQAQASAGSWRALTQRISIDMEL